MNKKSAIKLLVIIISVLLCVSLFTPMIPAGDYIDPGGDWGGGGGDWGGGSDWGDSGSDWGDNDWGDSGNDSDSGSSGGFFFFGDGDGGSGGGGFIIFIIIIASGIVIATIVRKNRSHGSPSGRYQSYSNSPIQMSDTSSVNMQSLEKLKQTDPDFSESSMLSKANNLFMTMQVAWSNQKYEPIRPFLSNALYEQQAKQLMDKIARDEKNVSSEIAVLQSKLESFSTDGHTEFLNVWLRIKMKDHIVKISDPSVIVSGNPGRMYYLDFRWQFTRSAGAKTIAATDAVKTGECPNCGANININQSGKCEYCGSVISTTEYDWVLSKIDALQQRSR